MEKLTEIKEDIKAENEKIDIDEVKAPTEAAQEVKNEQKETDKSDINLVNDFFKKMEENPDEQPFGSEISPLLKQVDTTVMAEAIAVLGEDIDWVNEIAVQIEFSAQDGADVDIKETINSIVKDIMAARNIPGIRDNIENLVNAERVGLPEWNGYRFELRYAAEHADEIAGMEEDEGDNYIDVKMKDGTYRELKSYRNYSNAIRDITEQLEKDITNRGAKDITVLLDKTFPPTPEFIKKLEKEINDNEGEIAKLARKYNAVIKSVECV